MDPAVTGTDQQIANCFKMSRSTHWLAKQKFELLLLALILPSAAYRCVCLLIVLVVYVCFGSSLLAPLVLAGFCASLPVSGCPLSASGGSCLSPSVIVRSSSSLLVICWFVFGHIRLGPCWSLLNTEWAGAHAAHALPGYVELMCELRSVSLRYGV